MSGKRQYVETGSDPAGIWEPNLRVIVEQEAPADLLPSERESFRNQMDLAYAVVPFCGDAGIVPRQYVFGLFIDGGTDPVPLDEAFDATKAELFREQVHSALSNWASCAGKQ